MHAVCAHGGFFRKKGKNNFGGHKKSPIFVNVILKPENNLFTLMEETNTY